MSPQNIQKIETEINKYNSYLALPLKHKSFFNFFNNLLIENNQKNSDLKKGITRVLVFVLIAGAVVGIFTYLISIVV